MEIRYKAFEMPDDFGIDIDKADLLAYEVANCWLCTLGIFKDSIAKMIVRRMERKYKKYVEFSKKIST